MGDDTQNTGDDSKTQSRPRYDTFAKEALGDTLERLGTVSPQHTILARPQHGDLWFEPHPNPPKLHPPLMALIGRMARTPALFEPFSTRPSDEQLRDVLGKALVLDRHRRTSVERAKKAYVRGHTWVLVPRISKALLARARARLDTGWGAGFYGMSELSGAHIVVIRELPENPQTLLLRLMGRGDTLKRAIRELAEYPDDLAQRWGALADQWLKLVHEHTRRAEEHDMIPPEAIEEVKRLVEQRYIQAQHEGERRGRLEGKLEGRLEGKREAIVLALSSRFQADEEVWAQRLSTIDDPDTLDALLRVAFTAQDLERVEAALP